MSDDLITIKQAASMLSCHEITVRRKADAGELGEIVRMGRKFVRIRKSAVEAYIREHTEASK
jgi:excisionase family DNA binding protein